MSVRNPVVWNDGLFMRPHHFQQQARYVEYRLDSRMSVATPLAWGVSSWSFSPDLLAAGKLSLLSAQGIFPDGSPFSAPTDVPVPPPLDVGGDAVGKQVYLAVPIANPSALEVSRDGHAVDSRYQWADIDVRDVSLAEAETAAIGVGQIRLRLMLESEDRSSHSVLPIAKIREVRPDGFVILDDNFVPTCSRVDASTVLSGYVNDALSLVESRVDTIVSRLFGGSGGDVSEVLLLASLNRHLALLRHLRLLPGLHPERLYCQLLELLGDLAAFTSAERKPVALERYQHDNLSDTFSSLFSALRRNLSTVLEQNTVTIPVETTGNGLRVANIGDRSLFEGAVFVLAAKAQLPPEHLSRALPGVLKAGPVEQIQQLVSLQLPGIAVQPIPVAPRQIPYLSGYCYFEVEQSSKLWSAMSQSAGFAFHVAGDIAGLDLQLWAIRG